MKSYKFFLTSISLMVVIFIAPSCDDILDDPQELQVVVSGVDYKNTPQMKQLIKGAYYNLYNIQWETFPLLSVRGDDVNAEGDQEPLLETEAFRYNRSFWMYNSTWLNLYSDIINWYSIIEELEKFNEFADDPAPGRQYIAEIKVMQVYELLLLARMWGGILIPKNSQTNTLYEAPITPFDEVMQYISDEIDEVIPLLSTAAPNERTFIPGGITVHTALAIKAMANLEMKNWQGVADATGEIISSGKFQLFSDYYELFKTPGKLADENILEFQYSDFGEGTGAGVRYLHAFFGPNNWTPEVDGVGPGWGFWEPSLKYITFMLDRGEMDRLETSVLFTDQGVDSLEAKGYTDLPAFVSNTTRDNDVIGNTNGNPNPRAIFSSGKHYLPSNQMIAGRTEYGSNKNFICIRYSEILLMHAEALVSGASSSAMSADEAVNAVRLRAGLGNLAGVTIDEVLDEKFAEFGMEWGIRFYDLVRHDKTSELVGYSEADRFLPYPLAQIDLLPQLDSN
ncbi:MAG: RagB/SusD family nutrient uptake outer membrane protein [Cyclobacteriaceae bacterium]